MFMIGNILPISFVIIFYYLNSYLTLDIRKTLLKQFKKNDTLSDLKKCRVTHSGVEFEGNVAQTKSGILCQNWETPDPIHKVAEEIVDTDFPEGNKKKAKNYCRNPQHWSSKPWCYTLDFNVIDEECDIPLCIKEKCRLTGPGVEYSGQINFAGSNECLHWSEIRGAEYKDLLYDSLFPDGTRKKALNRCRNPNSDAGGPWCFVKTEFKIKATSLIYEKEYCRIPFCEPKLCMTATASIPSGYQDYHTVFTLLPPNTTSIDFSVKLWNPDQWHSAELKIALATFPIPSTGNEMRLLKTGMEIIISTYKSGLTPEGSVEPDWNIEPGLLSGTHWQDLELTWEGGFVSLKIKGKSMSVFTNDFTGHEKHFSQEQFRFFSIKGSNALWSFPFCKVDSTCEELVTTHGDFERRWPLLKSTSGFELKFFVRGFHTAIIELKSAAMVQYPSVQLTLVNGKFKNLTTLTIKDSYNEERITLGEVYIDSLLSFWEWREFLLIMDGPRLELYSIKDKISRKLLSGINSKIEAVKWFSIGSRQSTVHWTISCNPPLGKFKIPAELPECVMNEGETEFSGFQSVSATGLTCVPWENPTGVITEEVNDSDFVDGSKANAKNYCRNPTNSANGPYCYTADLSDSGYVVSKQYCYPRKCRSKECKMAGTGNDYMGSLSLTASGRECQRWSAKTPHAIPQKLLSKELFPELSSSNASNFCRNPSHDIAGPWCYTNDITVETDICSVPDCDILDSCNVIVKGNTTRQHVYILPLWRTKGLTFKIKSWDPKWPEGIRFLIGMSNNSTYYRLELGGGNNDKVILYYKSIEGEERVLKQKTVARVIPSGSWAGFVLVLGFGEITIKYEHIPNAFFHWKYIYNERVEPFYAKYFSYTTISNSYSVGLRFTCEECHTHITQPGLIENIYPLNWGTFSNQNAKPTVLSLNVRGNGTFILVLMKLVGFISSRILIEVNNYQKVVVKDKDFPLAEFTKEFYSIFNNNSWTNIKLILTEQKLVLTAKNTSIIDYDSGTPLLFYFFSISVSDGFLIWSANCDPPNIDAPPVNGGWSNWGPWECSVSCGGGHGKRKRICDSPKPNLFGEACNGSDVMEGVCNNFKCGDIPPELYDIMENRASKQAHNIRKLLGESLLVLCDQYILKELQRSSPTTKVEWTKDGVPLTIPQRVGNITAEQFVVEIPKVHLNDSGIYMCVLENRKGQRAIIQFTAVTIVANISTKSLREGSVVILDCQAMWLSYIFSDLFQFWTLNGELFQDYGAASQSMMDIDLLYPVSQIHDGEWECNVVHIQHNLTWVTSWFRLEVKKNSILAITFDKMFLGHHFTPFGNNVTANSILSLILLLVVVFFTTITILLFYFTWKKRQVYMPLLNNEHTNIMKDIPVALNVLQVKPPGD